MQIAAPSAAPRSSFLLGALGVKLPCAALATTGLPRNRDAAPRVPDALEHARSVKVRRAAVEALAMIADPADHAVFLQNLTDKADRLGRAHA